MMKTFSAWRCGGVRVTSAGTDAIAWLYSLADMLLSSDMKLRTYSLSRHIAKALMLYRKAFRAGQ
jgi:hypothetical protein